MTRLILASQSPRRRALLAQIGILLTDEDVVAAGVDETRLADETPAAYVERLARAKARAGHQPGAVTLGADTVVVIDDEILGKPCGQREGVAMLRRLAARTHSVLTGVAGCSDTQLESFVTAARVTFRDIDEEEALAYWQTGEPADKAGGYGIQGIGSIFAKGIEGSYSAVVGLPLQQTEALLRMLNIDTWSVRIDGRRTPD